MKSKRFFYLLVVVAIVFAMAAPIASMAQAQTSLPTAAQVASQIKTGWNLGNTLEATPCGETAWGNPMVTQAFIDSVKAAGFNSIRIPAAWDCHAINGVIDAAWMARVKQVVDYAINDGMYVVLNIHWDGGWLENHVTYADQTAVNAKQKNYWTQIANTFKSYNEHLLFAGTNETHQDYGTPTAEYIAVQQSYLQTFVDAVRATGGNNATRTLVVQTYNTNIAFGLSFFTLPTDSAANRMIVEVHYYDPYDYTLNPNGSCLYWGAPYPAQSNCAWAQESYMDNQFALVKEKWVDAGVPVIIGEYGVSTRPGLDLASRQYYLKYLNQAALTNGIKTYYWDNGVLPSQNGFALFNRTTGAIVDQGALNAVIQGSSPCTTCTATPSRTPTRTPTITPTACAPSCGSFAVSIKSSGTETTGVSPFNFSIKNTGTSAVTGLSSRIYFTLDGANPASNYSFAMYYDGSGAGVVGAPVQLTSRIYSFPVNFGTASLAAGATWEFQISFHLADWATTFNPVDDWYHTGYALNALPAAYTLTSYIPVYVNGSLASGIEPGMGPTPTSGPSKTPTLTPIVSLTPTRTLTPLPITLTPTRTFTLPAITNTPTRTATIGITNTPSRTFTPPAITNTPSRTATIAVTASPTTGTGTCSPVTSTITAPFTFDGAGTFCWQSSNLGTYINSWNTTSVSVNGVNATNIYVAAGSLPAKIGGFWYVAYNSAVAWGHFESK